MWVKWVTIHESFGLPRAAQELRCFLELEGIRVRLVSRRTKRAGHVYALQVPRAQRKKAEQILYDFRKRLGDPV